MSDLNDGGWDMVVARIEGGEVVREMGSSGLKFMTALVELVSEDGQSTASLVVPFSEAPPLGSSVVLKVLA